MWDLIADLGQSDRARICGGWEKTHGTVFQTAPFVGHWFTWVALQKDRFKIPLSRSNVRFASIAGVSRD